MAPSPHVSVVVDLERVRQNARAIAARTGVPIIAVVKADAYGSGATVVAEAIAPLVSGFYVFDAREAYAAGLHQMVGKPTIALHGALSAEAPIRPVVWTAEQAASLGGGPAVLSVDTGQQRFGCPPEKVESLLRSGNFAEAMTHATTAEQARRFEQAMHPFAGRQRLRLHAAGSALLDLPAARFDAVRPGMALYQDAVTVTIPLAHAADSIGPAGYGGFVVRRFGVILAGYDNGLRVGPCLVNGKQQQILEVGMQSAFVEIDDRDRVGGEVTLMGPQLPPQRIALDWGSTPQAVLVALAGSGVRRYENR